MITELTEKTFADFIASSDKPVLVDFWAPWCGPCRMLSPVVDDVSEQYGDKVNFAKVNVDECGNIAMQYSVMSIPLLILFKNGEPVANSLGFIPEDEVKSFIDKNC